MKSAVPRMLFEVQADSCFATIALIAIATLRVAASTVQF